MADAPLSINWHPLDFSGLAKLPEIYQAAQNARRQQDRADEYLSMEKSAAEANQRRASAEEVRRKAEFDAKQEELKHQREVERTHAFGPAARAARQSPELGNMMGSPYGISFDAQNEPPSLAGTDLFKAHNNAYGNFAQEALSKPAEETAEGPAADALEPTEEGPEASVEAEAKRFPAPAAPEGPSPIDAAHAVMAGPAIKNLYATVAGQRFQLPAEDDSTGLGEKYDAVYKHILDRTGDEGKAYAAVLAEKEKDDAIAGSRGRTDAQIEARMNLAERDHMTADIQEELRRAQMAQSETNARINAASRLGAARIGAGPRQQQAENADVRTFMQAAKEAKKAAGSEKDIATLKNIEKIDEELASDSPAAQNAAVDTLAQIAQGGKASIAVMNVFQQHSVGPLQIAKDKVYQALHKGQHSPEYLDSFKRAVKGLKEVATAQRTRAMSAYDSAAGDQSQYAQRPNIAPYVANERKAYAKELGIPEGAAHPSEEPAGATRVIGGVTYQKVGPNNWQPVQQ